MFKQYSQLLTVVKKASALSIVSTIYLHCKHMHLGAVAA